jgi:hypothetical protein
VAAAPLKPLGAPGRTTTPRASVGGPGTHTLLVALAPALLRGIQVWP